MSSSATPSSRIGWGVMAGEEVTLYSEILEFSHLFACSSRFRFEFRAGHRLHGGLISVVVYLPFATPAIFGQVETPPQNSVI